MQLIIWGGVLIAVVIAIGAVAIFIFQRKRARPDHQDMCLLGADNSIMDKNLNVIMECATDKNRRLLGEMSRGWIIDQSNQVRDDARGGYVQICADCDATPIQIFGNPPAKLTQKKVTTISAQITDDEIYYAINKGMKSDLANKLWVVILILTVILGIEIIGKLHVSGVF